LNLQIMIRGNRTYYSVLHKFRLVFIRKLTKVVLAYRPFNHIFEEQKGLS
jgi:hypothetical protein